MPEDIRHMPTRRLRPVLLILLLVILAAPVRPSHAAAAGADLVFEAIQLLDTEYVDQAQVERTRLLNAALEGMKEALGVAGVTARFAGIAPGTPAAEAQQVFRAAFDAAVTVGRGKMTPRELAYAAIRAVTASLNDSHTGFVTPEQYRERLARQRQQAGFTGVGMVVMPRDARFYVWQVIPRSPADRQGVRQFDRIIRINNVPTGGLTSDQVVSMIRGPAGTRVTVTFERPGRPGTFAVAMTRAPIVVPAVLVARTLEREIGYIYLYEFSRGSARDLRRALQTQLGRGLKGLILDLRGNTGGFLPELDGVLNLFLPRGVPVYQSSTSKGTDVVRTTRSPLLPLAMPLVVLVNENTASAAELLAAAVAEHQRGRLVGVKTAGAVEASTLFELSDGSALSVTIWRLSTGKGRRLEGVGITPEVVLDLTAEDFLQGRDAQVSRGVQIARQVLGRTIPAAPSPVPTSR